jgi:hypothetical protein
VSTSGQDRLDTQTALCFPYSWVMQKAASGLHTIPLPVCSASGLSQNREEPPGQVNRGLISLGEDLCHSGLSPQGEATRYELT